jgi:hypothetical protein
MPIQVTIFFLIQKTFFNFLKICIILLRFMLKICTKYVVFKVFQVHLQILSLLKNNGYIDITLLLKVQMLMK